MNESKEITSEQMWLNFRISIVEVPKFIKKAKPEFRPLPLIPSIKEDAVLQQYLHYLFSVENDLKDILMKLPDNEPYLFLNHLKDFKVGIGLWVREREKAERMEKWYLDLASNGEEKDNV